MSARGRKHEHVSEWCHHVPPSEQALSAASKVLIGILVATIVGCGWGWFMAGGLLDLAAGIGEAMP